MFSNANLYNSSNTAPQEEAKRALDKFVHLMMWKEGETILDAGSGSGNVTTDILAPRLPEDFKKLVGLDKSESMVSFANSSVKDPRITFVVADIAEPDFAKLSEVLAKEDITAASGFDKIFSFNCLQWIKDVERCAQNLYSLLRNGGEMLILFAMRVLVTDAWNETAFSERWLPYTKTAEPIKFRYQDSKDINGDVTKLFSDAGFLVRECTHYDSYVDVTRPQIRKLMECANPFAAKIPEELRPDYLEEVRQTLKKYQEKYDERGLPFTEVVLLVSKP